MHNFYNIAENEEDEDEEEDDEGGGESIFQETDFKLDEFLNRCVMNRMNNIRCRPFAR